MTDLKVGRDGTSLWRDWDQIFDIDKKYNLIAVADNTMEWA
jgi:hypothetical protein